MEVTQDHWRNVNGYVAPTRNMLGIDKCSAINHTVNKKRIAILALQETHLDRARLQDVVRSTCGAWVHAYCFKSHQT